MQHFFEDLQQHGCISGWIAELTYYNQTTAFYQKYVDDINELLSELLQSCGITDLKSLLRNRDEEDPLIQDNNNQNVLARFGFEETMYNISIELGFDD